MFRLDDKVAVVTGAAKGLGSAICKGLGAAGAKVVAFGRGMEGLQRTVMQLTQAGGRALAVAGDVTNPDDIDALIRETGRRFGAIDVLVNCAAVFKFTAFAEVTAAEFHQHFDTNVLAPILLSQRALAGFNPHGGSIINISSIGAGSAVANGMLYAASKLALNSVTRTMATELGPKGIRVNAIAPGTVPTEGVLASGVLDDKFMAGLVSTIALGRVATPDDIAKVAVFLASDEAGWITGEIITASGGQKF